MNKNDKVYIAGHTGLAGSAILRKLQKEGFKNLCVRTHDELDLISQADVDNFFAAEKPDFVILAAAKVGGIHANSSAPADFICENLLIAANVIRAAKSAGVKKLLNLGSSCIYPRMAAQPIKEEYLLTGPLESTNRAYAVAKIAAIEMCDAYRVQYGCDYISAMPTNLYGPFDNFHPENSHVLPALIRRFHEATSEGEREVIVWGTGTPRREFLYSDDLADAVLILMDEFSDPGPINVGTGQDLSILELAELIAEVVGYQGRIVFDATRPDGTPRKLLDVSRIYTLGWRARIGLREGLRRTYDWFLHSRASGQ